jgi:hypothetical protein
MSTSPTHFVFVDFENVPDIELGLITGLPVHVSLLIGKNQTKLHLPLVQQIHKLADQVDLIEVGGSGRNALDLTLAYYLGHAIQQMPTLKFHIISGDKDFDPLIAHIHAKGLSVTRHTTFAALPFLPRQKKAAAPAHTKPAAMPVPKKSPAPTAKPPAIDRSAKVIARLSNPSSKNRPASSKALLAHLKASLGKEATDAKVQETVSVLQTKGVLSIDAAGKIQWPRA